MDWKADQLPLTEMKRRAMRVTSLGRRRRNQRKIPKTGRKSTLGILGGFSGDSRESGGEMGCWMGSWRDSLRILGGGDEIV